MPGAGIPRRAAIPSSWTGWRYGACSPGSSAPEWGSCYPAWIGSPTTLSAFAVWQGGLTFFGGLAGGLAAGWWVLRRQPAPIAVLLTAIAPAIPLAQAIGRWGNYFNQELYGRPTDLPWGLEIEPAYRVAGYQAHDTFHPAFLYEVLWNLALVTLLIWAGRRLPLRDGSLFLLYLIGYGVGRFWIELLRIDTEFRLLGLSRNQYNSLLIVTIGIAGLWWWQRRAPVPEPDPEEPEPAEAEPRDASTSAPAHSGHG